MERFTYTLRPRTHIGPDMLVESDAVLGILKDKDRFPDSRESILSYTVNIPKKSITITLDEEMDVNIHEYLNLHWEICKGKYITKYIHLFNY